MDMESLAYFLDVWKSGNITNAANNHYITQSALSKRLALLEKELGVQLFQRGKGQAQVIITPAGMSFAGIAERMLLLYGQALELKRDEGRQFLNVACIQSVQNYVLPPLIIQLEQEKPHLCVMLEDHHSAEIFSLLENHRVDIGIAHAAAPFPDLQSDLLFEESYRVVMRAGNGRFLPGTAIHPGQLCAEQEIFEEFDSEFRDWHDQWWKPFQAKIRVNTTSTAEHYFHSAENWMIVPSAVARSLEERGFVSYPLKIDPPRRRVFILYRKRTNNVAVKEFVSAAKAYFSAF